MSGDQKHGELIQDAAIQTVSQDTLGLDAVAEAIESLIATTGTPATVAVFGAWGSGKTSLASLVRERLSNREKPSTDFVYFNAWKYAETPLRRHFLLEAARALDEPPEFARQLYSKRKSTRYRLERRSVGVLASVAGASLGAALLLIASAQALAWLADQASNYWQLLGDAIAANAGALLVSTSLLVPIVSLLANSMKVDLDESEPSSAEQFDRLFQRLIAKHTKSGKVVVFFIDELDRAPAVQMQSVLETMKTFLDHRGCVFIVAADQVVLEEAISGLETVTVPGRGNPYYSSGAAYLDKIFQYQFHLPAFEASTLTRFARDLVADRSGIWAELGSARDDIISLLVPSHVRSPRRVKILLNNFGLAVRVAKMRLGSDSFSGAELQQLAKLVCLRTEFPLFYRDVEANPYLVDAATSVIVGDASRMAQFAEFTESFALARKYAGETGSVDVGLGDAGDPDEVKQSSDQLREYLRRTQHVKSDANSLVFLQPPGSNFDLPSVIARQLETAARDGNVDAALETFRGIDPDLSGPAIDYLASQLADTVGVEVRNATVVFMAVVGLLLESEVIDRARAARLAQALDRSEVWRNVDPSSAITYLNLAARLSEDERQAREALLLAHADEPGDWPLEIVANFKHFSGPGRLQAKVQFAGLIAGDDPSAIAGCERIANDEDLVELLDGEPLRLLGSALADESIALSEAARSLAQSLIGRIPAELRWSLLRGAIQSASPEKMSALAGALKYLPPASSTEDADATIGAMSTAPATISVIRHTLVDEGVPASRSVLTNAIASILDHLGQSDTDVQDLQGLAKPLSGSADLVSIDPTEVMAALKISDWSADWSDDLTASNRKRQHAFLDALSRYSATDLGSQWLGSVATSVAAIIPSSSIGEVGQREILGQAVGWAGPRRPPRESLDQIFELLTPTRPGATGDKLTNIRRKYALFLVGYAIRGVTEAQREVLLAELPTGTLGKGSIASACHAIYVAVARPSLEDDPMTILKAATTLGDEAARSFAIPFFQGLSGAEVTRLLTQFHDTGAIPDSALLEVLGPKRDESRWATVFVSRLLAASTVADRKFNWRFLAALKFRTPKARRQVLNAALETMVDTSGSFKDLLLELPSAFPDWAPDRDTRRVLARAADKHTHRNLSKRARQALDILRGR